MKATEKVYLLFLKDLHTRFLRVLIGLVGVVNVKESFDTYRLTACGDHSFLLLLLLCFLVVPWKSTLYVFALLLRYRFPSPSRLCAILFPCCCRCFEQLCDEVSSRLCWPPPRPVVCRFLGSFCWCLCAFVDLSFVRCIIALPAGGGCVAVS